MKERLRRHAGYVIAGLIASVLTAGGPAAVAAVYDAVNSDMVDGKHAVGAGATVKDRAGKLVATNREGRLPNSIIAQALDSDRLDGRSSASFARSTVPSGAVVRGEYVAKGRGAFYETFNFGVPLATPVSGVELVPLNAFTANCPAFGTAARGYLCIYEHSSFNRDFLGSYAYIGSTDAGALGGTSRFGFTLGFQCASCADPEASSFGEWALRVP